MISSAMMPWPRRRTFMHGVVAKMGADRRDVGARRRREVFRGMGAALGPQRRHHLGGDRALVEGATATLGDRAQRAGECREPQNVAGSGRVALPQVGSRRGRALGQQVAAGHPVEGDAWRDGKSFGGQRDCGLQQAGERQPPMIGGEPAPRVDRARDRHGMRRIMRDGREPLRPERRRIGAGRCPAGAVEGVDRGPAARRIEHEAVAADAGHARLHHTLHGAGRNRGIHRVAARLQRLDGGQCRRGVRGRGHCRGCRAPPTAQAPRSRGRCRFAWVQAAVS